MNSYKDKIIQMINTYRDRGYFSGNTNEAFINKIESYLGVALPESYKWYIIEYGSGGLGGTDILGVTKIGTLSVVDVTQRYQRLNLPKGLIVIEDVGEWVYCLDTNKMFDGECPVVTWSRHDKDGIINRSANFFEYIIDCFSESIDNFDDI